MVLVAMITLIMAFALRINLQAWERGVNEGEKVQIEVVLPHMLERQLRSIISSTALTNSSQTSSSSSDQTDSSLEASINSLSGKTSLSTTGTMTQLQFLGREQSLLFYTLYSPQGTPSQGLIRVAYVYDQDAKELTVYEKVIGSADDIKESDALFSPTGRSDGGKSAPRYSKSVKKSGSNKSGGRFNGQAEPLATIQDVEHFSLSFLAGEDSTAFKGDNPLTSSYGSLRGSSSSQRSSSSSNSSDFQMDGSSFQDSWDQNSPDPPGFIRLLFAQTKRRGGTPSVWLFRVGGKI